ncbi:hypothetical protein SLEP1_g32084 [Rubroshorea leprosula]|uniref:Uncharacterized protein n=1 Tax=Rubroshorea leprosula TaxID=152421 RepID=A0AAV5KC96_9ROSI|nr:hypothetical protein SLEP1_g32084 [Rubroshorea leprosula]
MTQIWLSDRFSCFSSVHVKYDMSLVLSIDLANMVTRRTIHAPKACLHALLGYLSPP